jgi:hypothetical protein
MFRSKGTIFRLYIYIYILVYILYDFFWVIPRRLNFICLCLGTLEPKLFPYTPQHLSNLVHSTHTHTYLPMKMEWAEGSETSVYKNHTPGNYQKEIIQHSEYGESLKSRIYIYIYIYKITKKRHRVMGGLYINAIICTVNWFLLK